MNKKMLDVISIAVFGALLAAVFLDRLPVERPDAQPEIVLLGDSIFGQVQGEGSIADRLQGKLGRPVFCGALGGTCMSRRNEAGREDFTKDVLSMDAITTAIALRDFGAQQNVHSREYGTEYFDDAIDRLETIDFDQVEILFLCYGMNDYHAAAPLDNALDPLDTSTLAGALRSGVGRLREAYPELRIIVVTPTYSWYTKPDASGEYAGAEHDFGGGTLNQYVEKEIEVAGELGVELLDIYHDFYPDENRGDCWRYTADGLHPNEAGREKIAQALADDLGR